MNTFQKLVKLIENDKNLRKELIEKLNYRDISSGSNKLLTQLRNKSIHLNKLKNICDLINYDKQEVIDDYLTTKKIIQKEKETLEKIKWLNQQIKARDDFKSSIYVITTKTKPDSITLASLISHKLKYINNLSDDIQNLSKKEQLEIIKPIIKKHYQDNQGKCFLFGDITGYSFYRSFNETIHLSVAGEVIS